MSVFAHSVAIGPEFFDKAFYDYSNRFWAFVREIMQNSMDCGSTRVNVWVVYDEEADSTVVTVENNGEPMTDEILVGKLLSLGPSGKDFKAGAVGGFGKAKEILYFAHKSYRIESGYHVVAGSGAGYDLETMPRPFKGTRSTVAWKGNVVESLRMKFERFMALCGREGIKVTLDGRALRPGLARLEYQRPLERGGSRWADVFVGKAHPGHLVVRVNGVPMFEQSVEYKGSLVVELVGSSNERLTSNRDGLKHPYSGALQDFTTQIVVDRRTALILEKPEYTRFAGPRLHRPRMEPGEAVESGVPLAPIVAAIAATMTPKAPAPPSGGGIASHPRGLAEAPNVGLLGHEFIVKNCFNRAVPPRFDPNSLKFDDHAHWLVRGWSGSLLELYTILEIDGTFSVGFIFSQDCEAQYEATSEFGHVYFLNPCRQNARGRLVKQFRRADAGRVAALAAHEFVHGAYGETYHGEDFASKLTEVAGVVMSNWRRFARHFR